MDTTYATTAAAAESEAQELLEHLTQRQPRTCTPADLGRMAEHKIGSSGSRARCSPRSTPPPQPRLKRNTL